MQTTKTPIVVSTNRMEVMPMPEREASISLLGLKRKLDDHRGQLIAQHGLARGKEFFNNACSELYAFVERMISEGKTTVSVRLIGRTSRSGRRLTDNAPETGRRFYKVVYRDEQEHDHVFSVNESCVGDVQKLKPSERRYELVTAGETVAA